MNVTSSVELADEERVSEYNKDLERIKSYSNKDTYFDLEEKKTIRFLKENQIVLTNKCFICFLNKRLFMFFAIIGLAEFYKIFSIVWEV